MDEKTWNVDSIKPWVVSNVQFLMDHPETWPKDVETPILESPFWACLSVRKAIIHGEEQWLFDAVAYEGQNAEIEMSMNMAEGNKEELRNFMQKVLKEECSKPMSYISSLCRRLWEKD